MCKVRVSPVMFNIKTENLTNATAATTNHLLLTLEGATTLITITPESAEVITLVTEEKLL